MRRLVNTLVVCLVAGAFTVAAQNQQAQEQQKPQPEVTLTGCLTQGSMPSVFVLENAKPAKSTSPDRGMRYLIVPDSSEVELLSRVNNEVELRGVIATTEPPPGTPAPEKDLPQLRAREVAVLASTCSER